MSSPVYTATSKEEAIATYVALGWKVMLCQPQGKAPLAAVHPHGLKDATDNVPYLLAALRHYPDANLAIATGERSGLWVLDSDGEPGFATIDAMEARYGPLPATLAVQTGRGLHLYFAWPNGTDIRSKAGVIGPGLDQRGNGGYVAVPPSVHPSGARYEWRYTVVGDVEIAPSGPAPAPPWLVLAAMERTARIVPENGSQTLHTRGAGTKEQSEEGAIGEGRRNDELARKAGAMRRVGFTEAEILAALVKLNADRCTPPLDAREVERIATSIARYPVASPPRAANAGTFFRPVQIVRGRVQ